MSLLFETLTGSDLIHDLGYLESGLTFSFSHLVICDEIKHPLNGLLTKLTEFYPSMNLSLCPPK